MKNLEIELNNKIIALRADGLDKVFLGGTCNGDSWRDKIIPSLEKSNIKFFNPVVEDWNEECIKIEDDEKLNKCGIHLYVITSKMKGVYSIAELVNSCYTTPTKLVIVHIDVEDMDESQIKSLVATLKLVKSLGALTSIGKGLDKLIPNLSLLKNE